MITKDLFNMMTKEELGDWFDSTDDENHVRNDLIYAQINLINQLSEAIRAANEVSSIRDNWEFLRHRANEYEEYLFKKYFGPSRSVDDVQNEDPTDFLTP